MSGQASEYAVGYGKPPQQHQFKPGQSGNKKGRPKATESLDQVAKRVFNAPVAIWENGKRRTISKQALVVKRITDRAVAGVPGAIGEVVKLKKFAQQAVNDRPLIIQLVPF